LQARSERLPTKDALQVYDVATSKKRAELMPALMRKGAAFLKDLYETPSNQQIWCNLMFHSNDDDSSSAL
jgi:hypothetical protein